MLSFETRASAAVGVAISVTTIPASAYLGVAFGSGNGAEGFGALLVLAVNVVLLIVSGTATLFVQRRLGSRPPLRGEPPGVSRSCPRALPPRRAPAGSPPSPR